jgi:hypothetical protein
VQEELANKLVIHARRDAGVRDRRKRDRRIETGTLNVSFRQKEGKRDRDREWERDREKEKESSIFNELNGRI